jgi:Domain of unknown function (DUF892)
MSRALVDVGQSEDLSLFGFAQSAIGREPNLSIRLLRSTRSIGETAQSLHRSTGMGLFSKDIKSMEDLFLHTLQDVYYAENQIVKSLPKMIEKATNRELASGLRSHLAETELQVSRLAQAFEALGETPKGTDCPAMDGLLKEADNVAGEVDDKKVHKSAPWCFARLRDVTFPSRLCEHVTLER